MAMDEYLAAENKHQVVWRSSLAKDEISIFTKPLRAMDREPAKLLLGQPLQIFDCPQGRDDFSDAFVIDAAIEVFH